MNRIAYCLTHPIQYQSPLVRYLVASGIDLELVYATDITATGYRDTGFGQDVKWDVPLLSGYPYHVLFPGTDIPSGLSGLSKYYAALNTTLKVLAADVVWVHGWGNAYPLAAVLAAKQLKLPVWMRGETSLDCLHGGRIRQFAHKRVLSLLFRTISRFLAIGSANRDFYRVHGVSESRIHMAPYAVDNVFFQERCQKASVNRERLRQKLGIDEDRPIVLFSGKLTCVKDPATLIRAIGLASATRPMLLLAGDGILRPSLENLANEVAPGLVKFLGFCNQTELPAFYDLCDLFVLPSVFEPWGLVVNEAMNAGKPIVISNKVGAAYDLVRPEINGDVFTAGEAEDLYHKMLPWLQSPEKSRAAGTKSLEIINQWGFDENLHGIQQAIASSKG